MQTDATLYFVHDPMCSWCYAFRPVWAQVEQQLPAGLRVQYVLGGLAPDTDAPMPPETRAYVQGQWHKIMERVPGTRFNFEFWEKCHPRRATYAACRAVLLAREHGRDAEIAMIHAIQDAYYRQARDPSDFATLCELAREVGLPADAFALALNAEPTREALLQEIAFARSIGGDSFPSLFMQRDGVIRSIPHSYTDAAEVIHAIEAALAA